VTKYLEFFGWLAALLAVTAAPAAACPCISEGAYFLPTGKIDCAEFNSAPPARRLELLNYVRGFLDGATYADADPPAINVLPNELAPLVTKYCATHPQTGIEDIATRIWDAAKNEKAARKRY
jgi:hypothetical protein